MDLPAQPDATAVQRGTIPWTAEEFLEMQGRLARLHSTPRDDWDRRPHRVLLEDDGLRYGLRINVDSLEVQRMRIFVERYPDPTVAWSHSHRLTMFGKFVADHEAELAAAGLLIPGTGGPQVSTDLLELLMTAPYDRPVGDRDETWTWEIERVLRRLTAD